MAAVPVRILDSTWEVHVIGESGVAMVTGYAVADRLDPWGLRFEARAVAGRLVLTELTLTFMPSRAADLGTLEADTVTNSAPPSHYPESGIDSAVLENINHGQLLTAIYAKANESRDVLEVLNADRSKQGHAGQQEGAGPDLLLDAERALTTWASEVRPKRRGNPGHTPAYLRRVAEVRLKAEAEGIRHINAEVADRLDLPDWERARDHVNAATRAGWLMPGRSGRSQRVAGPKLLAAWRADATEPTGDDVSTEQD